MKHTGFILILLLLAGCDTPRHRQGNFDSPDPASKLYAIRRAGEAKDRNQIPPLVEQLKSDDPAVRVFAIQALDRITGERLGYNPYADLLERNEKVLVWEEAVKQKRFAGAGGNTP
ncbi:MAG: HEAT repeat domain-containing protein [Phycisphaeraceae bacterium]